LFDRAPSGIVNATLQYPYKPKSDFIIRGNINTSYLNESSQKKQARTYNMSHTMNFATGVQYSSSPAIANIFIERARLSSSCTSPIVNSLSDHDALNFLE
jgi:hypothetical protein